MDLRIVTAFEIFAFGDIDFVVRLLTWIWNPSYDHAYESLSSLLSLLYGTYVSLPLESLFSFF